MPKKIVWLTCILLLSVWLGGCQLAREDTGEDTSPGDRFVGVYITFQHLDSPMEYYAKPAIIEREGHQRTTFEFDVPGIAFFEAKINAEGDLEGYRTTIMDDEIMDPHIGIHFEDDGEELDLSGQLYMLENRVLYVNRVYQDSTGKIYMLAGNGFHMGAGSMGTTATESMEGVEKKYSTKVNLAIEGVSEPERDVLKEFDANDAVIRTTVITPGSIPDSISLHPDCVYTIVETHSNSAEGMQVTRILLDIGERSYTYRYPGERGFLIGKSIEISKDN